MTKSLEVAVFVLPAASAATPSAIRSKSFPAVFTTTPEFVAEKVYEAPEPVSVDPTVHPDEAASLVISLISKPLTLSENVALIVYVLIAVFNAMRSLEPLATFVPAPTVADKETVGRVVSMTTPAKAVDGAVVVLPSI